MQVNLRGDRRRRRVGLLGGSFNPAHAGHLYISLYALRQLGLDEVWWLVSPQNPLKPTAGMASQQARLESARKVVGQHRRIVVTGLEARLGTRYTADTLGKLGRMFPGTRFVWLMGADNLGQIPRWDRWLSIFRSAAVAVFDRSPYSYQALAGRAAKRFARFRKPLRQARLLADQTPPAWVYLHMRRHPASASAIRRHLADGGIRP